MASEPKYETAEIEYVQTPGKGIPIRAVAKKWGVPQGTMATRSRAGQWKASRDEYWTAVGQSSKAAGVARHAGNADQIKSQIEGSLDMLASIIHDCLIRVSDTTKPKTDGEAVLRGIIAKVAFERLKCAKIATEAINNLDDRVNEIYGLTKQDGSPGVTPEDIARAVDALAGSSGTIPAIPRSELN